MPHTIDLKELEKHISQNKERTIVAYLLTNCYPCQNVEKYLDEIKNENKEISLMKYKVDEEEEKYFSKRNNIEFYPVILIFKDGKLKRKREGYLSKEEIKVLIYD